MFSFYFQKVGLRRFLLVLLPLRCPFTSPRRLVQGTGVPAWPGQRRKVTLRPGGAGAGQAGEGLVAGGPRSLNSASPTESLVFPLLEILKLGFQFNYILIKWNKGGHGGSREHAQECLLEFQSCFFWPPTLLEVQSSPHQGCPAVHELCAHHRALPRAEGQQVAVGHTGLGSLPCQLPALPSTRPQTPVQSRKVLPKITPKVRGRSGT